MTMETMSIPGILVYESGQYYIRNCTLSLPLKELPKVGLRGWRLWRLELSGRTRWKVVRSFGIR